MTLPTYPYADILNSVTVTGEARTAARMTLADLILGSDKSNDIMNAVMLWMAAMVATAERRRFQGHDDSAAAYVAAAREIGILVETAVLLAENPEIRASMHETDGEASCG